jgi:ribonuclease-3
MPTSIAELLGLSPDSPRLLEALTHPSYANERRGIEHNQRLEFLGDAVLGFCVSELLYARFPGADEGALTRMRAQLVNTEALACWARTVGLSERMRLGRGALAAGLGDSTNILADAVESLIAAVYLDLGLEAARACCAQVVDAELSLLEQSGQRDPKSELQERLQALGVAAPTYQLLETSGPAHQRWFRVGVRQGDRVLGEGSGRSKRAAERAAAMEALAKANLSGLGDVPEEP